MSNRFHVVNAPDYAHQFSCVGPACPDTCCSGWRVDVDKTTYKKMQMLPNDQESTQIKSYFQINPEGDTLRYAFINMDSTGGCPVQSAEGLCNIQSRFGEDFLSKTCRTYPRQISHAGEGVEMYLQLSCPEAARLCLESDAPAALSPLTLDIPKGKPLTTSGGFSTSPGKKSDPITGVFWLLRDLIADLSQRTDMPLWEVVVLVGIVCERLKRRFSESPAPRSDEIELIVLEAKLAALDGSFHRDVAIILPEERVLGMRAIYTQVLTNERLKLASSYRGKFFDLVAEAFKGYNTFMDTKASSTYVWSDQNPIVEKALRNYLRNEVGLQAFPNLKDPDLLQQWRRIVIRYSLVSFYLQGLSKFHKEEFGMGHAVALVQGFSKAVAHNSAFLPRVDELLVSAGLDGVAGLGILAR
jgi:lysine-N-methylase